MPDRVLKAIAFSSIEFVFLLGLWMLFVSQLQPAEFVAGVAAALLGAIGDGVVKSKRLAKFGPRPAWLWLLSWEPWYVLTGTIVILRALARRLSGKRTEAEFRALRFRAGGDDAESAAQRALAITAISISPDTIVVGVDRKREFMLLHLIAPRPATKLARKLGAEP